MDDNDFVFIWSEMNGHEMQIGVSKKKVDNSTLALLQCVECNIHRKVEVAEREGEDFDTSMHFIHLQAQMHSEGMNFEDWHDGLVFEIIKTE